MTCRCAWTVWLCQLLVRTSRWTASEVVWARAGEGGTAWYERLCQSLQRAAKDAQLLPKKPGLHPRCQPCISSCGAQTNPGPSPGVCTHSCDEDGALSDRACGGKMERAVMKQQQQPAEQAEEQGEQRVKPPQRACGSTPSAHQGQWQAGAAARSPAARLPLETSEAATQQEQHEPWRSLSLLPSLPGG